MSANANANAASTRSEIQKFAQKCLQHNQAYDEHAAWLSSLRGEIGKSIHKLHDQGIVANAEMRMASRRDAKVGDFRVEDV
jgi:ribosomal protein S20